jgi:hypothetical protein
LSPALRPAAAATTFSPSLVEKRKPSSSGSAPKSRAICLRTASVVSSIRSRWIGLCDFARANSVAAATTGAGEGVMYAEFR